MQTPALVQISPHLLGTLTSFRPFYSLAYLNVFYLARRYCECDYMACQLYWSVFRKYLKCYHAHSICLYPKDHP